MVWSEEARKESARVRHLQSLLRSRLEQPKRRSLFDIGRNARKSPEERQRDYDALFAAASKSRTFSGDVDVFATRAKAGQVVDASPEITAAKSQENFKKVFDELWGDLDHYFSRMTQVTTFVDGINKGLNEGLVKEGVLLRTDDSRKFPYVPVNKLHRYRLDFGKEFLRRESDSSVDPVETAAWVQWQVNIEGHFYADGCGRTAEMLAGWVLARESMPMPKPVTRKEFYSHVKNYDEFLAWYRTLFDAGGKG
jgi:hypothetical protein